MNPTLTDAPGAVVLHWDDGHAAILPHLWLRDTDPAGFHSSTGERAFDLLSVPADIAPDSVRLEQGALVLRWPGAASQSRFDLSWLRACSPGTRRADPAAIPPEPWRADLGQAGLPRVQADTVMRDDAALLDWLCTTKRLGLSIVEGLPDDAQAGTRLAARIGFLRRTNFGTTFEVVSKPDPNNLAYTADALPLHTDLTNQPMPPGWQFLHCIANDADGGGSVFCDGVAVAQDLHRDDPDAFALLRDTPVPFRFHDSETDIRARRPVIVAEGDAVSEICFNAHLADILDLPADRLPAYYAAYRGFMQRLRDPSYAVTLKLDAGQMVVFDNRRVLHGREAFDPATGRRQLCGCYVDRGEWDSRMRVLSRG